MVGVGHGKIQFVKSGSLLNDPYKEAEIAWMNELNNKNGIKIKSMFAELTQAVATIAFGSFVIAPPAFLDRYLQMLRGNTPNPLSWFTESFLISLVAAVLLPHKNRKNISAHPSFVLSLSPLYMLLIMAVIMTVVNVITGVILCRPIKRITAYSLIKE